MYSLIVMLKLYMIFIIMRGMKKPPLKEVSLYLGGCIAETCYNMVEGAVTKSRFRKKCQQK